MTTAINTYCVSSRAKNPHLEGDDAGSEFYTVRYAADSTIDGLGSLREYCDASRISASASSVSDSRSVSGTEIEARYFSANASARSDNAKTSTSLISTSMSDIDLWSESSADNCDFKSSTSD